ncbi:hypothetical protein BPO_2381 [Bergeyella porcorum]|uniref:Uncharacterized protein n=1 Tax=Bergeyella porcorum TaxID=1735111 RepID=A0AAU0F4M1_9FLAO
MKEKNIDKKEIIASISKMMADKNSVRAYLKGKITLETLTQKGIKFAKPL